jgi:hypothetical protein
MSGFFFVIAANYIPFQSDVNWTLKRANVMCVRIVILVNCFEFVYIVIIVSCVNFVNSINDNVFVLLQPKALAKVANSVCCYYPAPYALLPSARCYGGGV